MNDAIWPSFIATPFIWPSVAAIRAAVSACNSAVRARVSSSERPTPATRAPACRAPLAPASEASFAARRTRPCGILSPSATTPA